MQPSKKKSQAYGRRRGRISLTIIAVEEEGTFPAGSNEGFAHIIEPDIGAIILFEKGKV